MTNAEVLDKVEKGYHMPMPSNCDPALYEIMVECWQMEPMNRPTFETLQWKLDEFFTTDREFYKDVSK